MIKAISSLVILFLSAPCCAEDWYLGGGVGIFDMDWQSSDPGVFSAHFNSPSVNVFAGYVMNAYIGAELQFQYIKEGSETDPDGFRSSFSGLSASPSIIVRYPLDRKDLFEVYARGGASYVDYRMSNVGLGREVSESTYQPMVGVGLRTTHFFLEYVYYGTRHNMALDQVRLGFRVFLDRKGE